MLRQSITIDFDMSGNSAMLPFLEHLAAFFSNLLNTCTTIILIHRWFTLILKKIFCFCFCVIDELFVSFE